MLIHVKVEPGAKKDEVQQKDETSFLVSTKALAERNQANTRVRQLLATHLDVPIERVRIISGHRTRGKIIEINK